MAKQQRDMDAGRQPFVCLNGERWPVSRAAMAEFQLEQGQTVNTQIAHAIICFHLAELEADIAIEKARTAQ